MARHNWTEESRNYLPIRTEAQLNAAARAGVRRWRAATRTEKNARNEEEKNAAIALIRQIILDEDSGKIPFVPVDDPPLPPIPTEEGDVVAIIRITKPATTLVRPGKR